MGLLAVEGYTSRKRKSTRAALVAQPCAPACPLGRFCYLPQLPLVYVADPWGRTTQGTRQPASLASVCPLSGVRRECTATLELQNQGSLLGHRTYGRVHVHWGAFWQPWPYPASDTVLGFSRASTGKLCFTTS